MGRPREFDENAALDAAIECFWAKGYEAVSVRDLAAGMKITGASLYNAFGDKRALYHLALARYLDQTVRERIVRLEGTLPPRQALVTFFGEVVERSLADKQHKGCMLVNSALELAPHDAEFGRVVAKELELIERFLKRCAAAGQRSGTIATSRPPGEIARLMLGVLLGIRVLARARPQRALLEGIAQSALSFLD